eukprot:14599889-Alexandrium_andersonii.AAC.1
MLSAPSLPLVPGEQPGHRDHAVVERLLQRLRAVRPELDLWPERGRKGRRARLHVEIVPVPLSAEAAAARPST